MNTIKTIVAVAAFFSGMSLFAVTIRVNNNTDEEANVIFSTSEDIPKHVKSVLVPAGKTETFDIKDGRYRIEAKIGEWLRGDTAFFDGRTGINITYMYAPTKDGGFTINSKVERIK